MRRTVLVLDASETMNSKADFTPTRLQAVWKPMACLASAFIEKDPMTRISVVVLRDGIARRICPPTSNAAEVGAAIQQRYADPRGSGTFALSNGLLAVMTELGLDEGVDDANAKAAQVLLLCGNVTSVDAEDVFRLVDKYRAHFGAPAATKAEVTAISSGLMDANGFSTATEPLVRERVPPVHIVSLDGAPNLLQFVAGATGGRLLCPMNPEHLARQLLSFVPGSTAMSAALEENPAKRRREPVRTGTERMTLMGVVRAAGDECPICAATVQSVPAPCRACGTPLGLNEDIALAAVAVRNVRWVRCKPSGPVADRSCEVCLRSFPEQLLQCDVCSARGVPPHLGVCPSCAEVSQNEAFCCAICGALGD